MKLLLYTILLLLIVIKCFEGPLDYSNQQQWPGVCPSGKYQSPIDIPEISNCDLSNEIIKIVSVNYTPISEKTLEFAHNYTFKVDSLTHGNITIILNRTEYVYELNNLHFHLNSEHTINGKSYSMEMHMVHTLKKEDEIKDPLFANRYLVIGVIFEPDLNVKDNYFISQLHFGNQSFIHNLNANSFILENKNFYYYHGGLTTPGCDESVNWIVMEDIYKMSYRQFEEFKKYISIEFPNGNNRNVQPLNGRTVYYIQRKIYISSALVSTLLIIEKLCVVTGFVLFFKNFKVLFFH